VPTWGRSPSLLAPEQAPASLAPVASAADEPVAAPTQVPGETVPAPTAVLELSINDNPNRMDRLLPPDMVHGRQEAQDALALAELKLAGKMAELDEARAMAERAVRHLERIERSHDMGSVREDSLVQAQTDCAVTKARVQAKQAEVGEAQLYLRQAKRRLAQFEPSSGTSSSSAPAATYNHPSADRSRRSRTGSADRSRPASDSTPAVPQTERMTEVGTRSMLAPAASATLPVPRGERNTDSANRALSGYAEYSALGGRMIGETVKQPAAAPTEERLRNLEKKLDTLLKEIKDLRSEMKPAVREEGKRDRYEK